MAAIAAAPGLAGPVDEPTYKRRVRSWIFYDWANSAFVTTITAALLPVYFSSVAGSTLPSAATATAYWGLTLSISLLISAVISPLLGTISDVTRSKKRFLGVFTGIGVSATAALVLVSTGDWVLAALLAIIGRIGLNGALVFYDSLLPHVARPEDRDSVSARGYAMGYLGGGLLLAINVAMFLFIPDDIPGFENAGVRLAFVTVAIWWAVFALPLFRQVPEPPSAELVLRPGETVVGVSFQRLRDTFAHLRRYRDLFLYLIAYLIYNDGIGTIINLAAAYGSELGFAATELILALLLVQFVGIPFSLVFGRLPNKNEPRRPYFLAFILFNAVTLPVVGIAGAQLLPLTITGQQPAPYATTADFRGQGVYGAAPASGEATALTFSGAWQNNLIPGADLAGEGVLAALAGTPADETYAVTDIPGDAIELALNGAVVEIVYAVGPNNGIMAVELDGAPLTTTVTAADGTTTEQPVTIDTYYPVVRYGESETLTLPAAGQYTLRLVNTADRSADSAGQVLAVREVAVLPPARQSSLPLILGLLVVVQIIGAGFALVFGRAFTGLAATLDARRSILLSLIIYSAIAIWGFFLNSTIEYWCLAWMVAIVQGGSQALSRSVYASMTPSSKSGEFFGLFSIMEKFASIIGPLLFALAATAFGSSRPAILSLIALFIIGGFLLTRVNIEAGQKAALEEDQEVYQPA